MSRRVLVGFTGGTRSSVLVALLREQECEMRGVFLDFSGFDAPIWRSIHDSVGTSEPARRAAARAAELGIDLEIISAGGLFEERVVDPYLHDALRGREASPEVLYHSGLLIAALRQLASKGHYDGVATGHRAILRAGTLLSDATEHCQASALAFAFDSNTLDLDFPLGGFTDAQITKLAQTLEFPRDSQPAHSIQHPYLSDAEAWSRWARTRVPPGFSQPGWVRECREGAGLVEHHGIYEYPIGVPIHSALIADAHSESGATPAEATERTYAVASEPETQTIWASPLREHGHQLALLTELRWLDASAPPPPAGLEVEVRRGDGHWLRAGAHVWAGAMNTGRLEFAAPVAGVLNGTHLTLVRQGRIVGTARASIPFQSPLGPSSTGAKTGAHK